MWKKTKNFTEQDQRQLFEAIERHTGKPIHNTEPHQNSLWDKAEENLSQKITELQDKLDDLYEISDKMWYIRNERYGKPLAISNNMLSKGDKVRMYNGEILTVRALEERTFLAEEVSGEIRKADIRTMVQIHDFTCIEHNDYGKEKCKVQCPYCEKI